MLIRLTITTIALLVVVGVSAAVAAQMGRPPLGRGGLQPPVEAFASQGTIEGIAPGRIQMLSSTNQRWMVVTSPQTRIELSGTATADFLAAGMYVRFTAEIDKQGNVKDKVSQLTIFSPSRQSPPGIQPAGAAGEAGAGGEQEKLGAAPGRAEGGKRHAKPGGGVQAGAYAVAGQIAGVQNGVFSVAAPGATLTIEVAEDAKIDLQVADLRFARQGDKISVQGKMVPGKPGLVQALYVKIEAAAPFSDPRAKSGKPAPKHEPRKDRG